MHEHIHVHTHANTHTGRERGARGEDRNRVREGKRGKRRNVYDMPAQSLYLIINGAMDQLYS